MTNVEELLRARQSKFVETRTRIEMEVNKFLESIDKTGDERVMSIVGRPAGKTCREVLPALWEERFDEEKYNEQRAAFDRYVNAVCMYVDALNTEALKCLQS